MRPTTVYRPDRGHRRRHPSAVLARGETRKVGAGEPNPRRVPVGFAPNAPNWGECAWTARDLKDGGL